MLFKFIGTLILMFSLLACTEEQINSPKARVGENPRVEEAQSPRPTQNDQELIQLEKIVDSKELSGQEKVFTELTLYLYGAQSRNPHYYNHSKYRNRLLLLTHLLKKWQTHSSEKIQQKVSSALSQYKNHFLDPCLEEADCSLVNEVLKRENSSVQLILGIARNTSHLKKRLNYLGLAFDISGRRKNQELLKEYTETTFQYSKENSQTPDKEFLRKHIINVTQLFEYSDWQNSDQWMKPYFVDVQPWKLVNSSQDVWNVFRKPLLKRLYSFYSDDENIRNEVHKEIDRTINQLNANQFDLKKYPAYSNLVINNEKSFLNYLALKFFNGDLDITQLNELYSGLPENQKNIDKMFDLFNVAIRWQIAQLGLSSTKTLSEKAQTYSFKSKTAIQEILDTGQDLVPRWSHFHNIQKSGVRKFLSTNIFDSKKYTADDIDNFIKAIDRNIYRAVVYPNMLALGYFMTQSDWEAKVRIWFWTFTIDTSKVVDRLITGQYPFPWYTFTDLKNLQTINGEYQHLVQADHKTRRTLYRSEIYDSLYYLFSTKTHQFYNIDSDKLLRTYFEKSANLRLEMLEDTLISQEKVYFNKKTEFHRYLNWCENIKTKSPTRERMNFTQILTVNIPFLNEIQNIDGMIGYPFYYSDFYSDTRHSLSSNLFINNDVFRLEYLPVLEFISHSLEIVKNLQKDSPELINSNWEKSNAYLEKLIKTKKAYLGAQLEVKKLVSDCQFVGQEESKRRSKEIMLAEKKYQELIVFPVLKKVTEGEITTTQANNFLKSLHDNSELYEDSINKISDQTLSVMIHRTTLAYRIRKFYKYGFQIDHPYTGKVNIPAVIGEDLKMPIPTNFMENRKRIFKDPRKQFMTSSTKAFDYHSNSTKIEFSSPILSSIFMHMKNQDKYSGDEFIFWDRMSAGILSDNDNGKRHMQFFANFHQLKEFEHLDYEKEECRDYLNHGPECLKLSQLSFTESTAHIDRWFKQYLLEDSDKQFFNLTGEKEFINKDAIDFITQFDASANMADFKDEALRGDILYSVTDLPYKKLNGYHDLLYEMIKADHLGMIFQTSIDINVESDDSDGKSSSNTCWSHRRECNWGSDRSFAREFHTARTERAGIFFNFDKRILIRDYNYVKNRVMTKYELLKTLNNLGDKLVREVREGQSFEGTVHMDIPEAPLHSLSSRNRDFDKDFSEFFREETGSFYLSEPNWESYLDPKVNWLNSK